MNLKLIFISLGLLLTELLTAQDQTTELSLKQVIEIARMESPDAQTHATVSVLRIGTINIIVPIIYRL